MAIKEKDTKSHNQQTIEKLKQMKYHETAHAGGWDITRVPGGLIYTKEMFIGGQVVKAMTSVFVQFPLSEPIKF